MIPTIIHLILQIVGGEVYLFQYRSSNNELAKEIIPVVIKNNF
jgi:hypothetical protein